MSDNFDYWILFQTLAVTIGLAVVVAYYFSGQKRKYLKITEDQSGKTIVITGANTGVGYASAMQCAQVGAKVILACRNPALGSQAATEIITRTGNKNVLFRQLDVTSFDSIEKFAVSTLECDVLINNAGAMFTNRETHLGIEKTMFTNYIGQFYLTKLMMPVLSATSIRKGGAEVRIVNIGSRSERLTTLGQEYTNRKPGSTGLEMCTTGPEPYAVWPAYGTSKFCDISSTFELHRRINRQCYPDINTIDSSLTSSDKLKANITVNSVTPGLCNTDLTRFVKPWVLWLTFPIRYFAIKSVEQGAIGIVYTALSKDLVRVSGKYFTDGKELTSSTIVQSEALGADLWIESERLIKVVKEQLNKNS